MENYAVQISFVLQADTGVDLGHLLLVEEEAGKYFYCFNAFMN